MTPAATPTEKRQLAHANRLAVEPFPPGSTDLLPRPVRGANDQLIGAANNAASARRGVDAAKEDLAAARAKDAQEAGRAADEGGPPKARTATKAEEKLDSATRLRAACAERLLQAKRGLASAVAEHQDEIVGSIDAEVERLGLEAAAAAAGLVAHLRRVQGLRALRGEVESDHTGREVMLQASVVDRAAERFDVRVLDAARDICAPRRFKDEAELTEDERAACKRARSQGVRQPRFETEAFLAFAEKWNEVIGS